MITAPEWFTSRILPVPGERVTCGNRTDLPERHIWADLGPDVADHGEQGIVEVQVRACLVCGRDDRLLPAGRMTAETS